MVELWLGWGFDKNEDPFEVQVTFIRSVPTLTVEMINTYLHLQAAQGFCKSMNDLGRLCIVSEKIPDLFLALVCHMEKYPCH